MTWSRTSEGLRHSALEPGQGRKPSEARLTDRQRLGVVMQGCALVGHLAHGGWRLDEEWRGARIDRQGVLRSVRARPGRSPVLAQDPLRRLLVTLFGGGAASSRPRSRSAQGVVPGRGQARRLARRLLAEWDQRLAPVSPDAAVATILDRAGFLWLPEHGPARKALVAEHRVEGGLRHTVAGRWTFAARLLKAAVDLAGLQGELTSDRAWEHWQGGGEPGAAMALAGAGRWLAAVEAWRDRPPSKPEERLALARCLHHLAGFDEALEVLRGLEMPGARILTASCLEGAGAPRAAKRLLDRLARSRLSRPDRVAAAEVRLRIDGRLGRDRRRGPGVRPPSRLLRAEAAWMRGDSRNLSRHLSQPRRKSGRSEQAWRWHRLRSLAALDGGRLEQGRAGLGAALGSGRRDLDRVQAAGLWREIGMARTLSGDLGGAGKALHQGVRLLRGMGTGRAASPVWHSLVEVRLRSGRPEGVRGFLRQAETATRRSGDLASRLRVAALRARWELFEGRPERALETCRQAGVPESPAAVSEDRDLLELLAGRALGWLGRRDESHRALESCGEAVWHRLEPEERASAWLVAGDPSRARKAAGTGALGGLIRRLAEGLEPNPADWRALDSLGPYRAARLVFDLTLARPDSIPPHQLRQAARDFRRLGSDGLARRLDRFGDGPWRAVRDYAESVEAGGPDALLADAGYPDVRLVWGDGSREIEVVAGPGGAEERSAPAAGGRLILSAASIDEPLAALFALVCRDYHPPREPRPIARSQGISGESPRFLAALDRADRLAMSDLPLLVEGETGTGKELVAKRVHAVSSRRDRPFLAINCAALAESLLLADLFGHVRGAFTGADRDRKGIFEAAAGGTVLLDEVGDLSTAAQGKLLRVLQEGEVRRVGESRVRQVDVRVLAATHRSLALMVAEGGFREDLRYRLTVGHVVLPPLRERGDDVVLLAERFLAEHGLVLDPAAREVLRAHAWPGNVRELRNVVDVAAAMADGPRIGPADLELPGARPLSGGDIPSGGGYHRQVETFRRRLVERALADSGGVRSEAARRLGLSRQAISYLATRFGID